MHSSHLPAVVSLLAGFVMAGFSTLSAQTPSPPVYEIGTVPDQRAWFSDDSIGGLAFMVSAPTLGDSPTISASWDMSDPPDGFIEYDADTDTFSFVPARTDTEPFKVTFLAVGAGSPIVQEVTIEPIQPLPSEATAFGLAPGAAIPDDTADDKYLQYVESRTTTTRAFNENPSTTTRDVKILGRTVILEKNHPNGLFEKLHYDATNPDYSNQDIGTLEIFADQVILRDPLRLPQTNVTVHAISMDFVDRGATTTTLSTVPLIPLGDTPPPQNTSNYFGIPEAEAGHRAGDITLYARDLQAPGVAKRLILTGGTGRKAAIGKNGAANTDHINATSTSYYSGTNLLAARVKVLGVWQYRPSESTYDTRRDWGTTLPSSYWGADAITPGRPGRGGDGGNASATVAIGALVQNGAGAAGTKAPNTTGGAGARIKGTNGTLYTSGVVYSGVYNALSGNTTAESGFPYSISTRNGANKTAPSAAGGGVAGTVGDATLTAPAWVTPEALRFALIFLRDAYLDGHNDFVNAQLQFYLAVIEEARTSGGWSEIDDGAQTALEDIANEMETLLERIRSNLDFFGNPAGWVPMLSFEVNYAAFQQEIDRALRLMYLNYWIGGIAQTLEDKRNALRESRKQLLAEIAADRATYAEAVKTIPGVRVQAEELQQEIDRVVVKIEELEEEALKKAKSVVAAKRAARVLGKIAQSFPIGQPALGAAGGALASSADIDPSKSFAENAIVVGQGTANGFAAGNAAGKAGAAKAQADAINVDNGDAPADPATEAALRQANKELLLLMKDTGETLLKSKASDPEIAAEMERILAENPAFRSLSTRLERLNARKRDFANQIAQLLQTITVLPLQIAQNLRTVAGLNTAIASEDDKVDAATVSYLKDIDGRARARLLKYHYYMARAYAYRRLQSYPGTLNLDDIFNKIAELAGANGAVLDATSFAQLKGVYEDQLSTVADLILADANQTPPEQSISVVFPLPQSVIDQLNAGEVARLNLKDLNLFPASEENLRITNLIVTAMDVAPDPTTPAPNAFSLVFKHSGISELQRDGETYLFRHYSESTRSAITWKTVKQFAAGGTLQSTVPSAASASLLGTLVGKNPSEILVYSRPAAYADLLISTEVNTTGAKVRVNSATVRVSYDFTARSEFIKSVRIATAANGIAPKIDFSTADRNDRGDGEGEFERVYDRNAVVTLTAPETYGEFKFVRWEGLSAAATSPSVSVTLSENLTLVPVYESLVRHVLTVQGGTGGGSYDPGDVVAIAAQVPSGKRFVRWEGSGVENPAAANTTVVVFDTATVSAVYESTGADNTGALINVSCRAFAGAGDSTLVVGFYISGTGSKTVLIRGVGPRLLDYIPGPVVADPAITLYSGDTPVEFNEDWDSSLAADFAQVGAFSLVPGSKDAAMKITLQPGLYTVHLVNDGPIAEGLIEVYDLSRDPGTRLTNVSCRLEMQPGQTVILGTALIGDPLPVLARNVGPGIAPYIQNPADALVDPHLRVYSGQNEVALNDNWEAATGAHFGPVGAFPLTSGSKDAAIRLEFQPGGYTIHATGNGGGGIAIIELYESQ